MASDNDPLQGLTIDQIDVSDPATRKHVSQYIDFNDPETKKYFQDNPVQGQRGVGSRIADSAKLSALLGSTNWIMRQGRDWFDVNKAKMRSQYEGKLARGEMTEDDLERITDQYNVMQEKIARGAIRSRQELDPSWKPEEGFWSNVGREASDLIGGVGGSGGVEMFLPGAVGKTAVGRIATAAGIGAATDTALQGADIYAGVEDHFDPYRAGVSAIGAAGLQGVGEGIAKLAGRYMGKGKTAEEIIQDFKDKGYDITPEEANAAVDYYNKGGQESGIVNQPGRPSTDYRNQGELNLESPEHQFGFDFEGKPVEAPRPKGRIDPAQAAAQRARMAAADELPIGESSPYRPWEPSQIEMDLQDPVPTSRRTPRPQGEGYGPEVDALAERYAMRDRLARASEEVPAGENQMDLPFGETPQPTPKAAPPEPTKAQNRITNYANKLMGAWKNAPETEVHHSFDDLPGVDNDALGVYGPDGKVLLNASLIEKAAKKRGITPEQMTNTVLFHEGLGHYGLAQKFREGLDGILNKWDKNSPEFRQLVDEWENNPRNKDTYIDEDDPRARAAEEVLAEMSETGKLPKPLLDQLKNYIKATARKMGFKWDYSVREIKTILAQAHAAVTGGKGADVSGNGYKMMRAANDDDIRLSDRPSQPAHNAGDAAWSKYYEDTAKHYEGRAKQARQQGNERRAKRYEEYAASERRHGARRNPDVTNKDKLNADYFRETADMYDRKFKEWMMRGDVETANLMKAEAERHRQLAASSAERSLNSPKYMKAHFGESEGTLQGGTRSEQPEGPGVGRMRSNRQIDDILEEAAPTRTQESWSEWIDDAGKIKMTGKLAQNLAKGTEVPELLAAGEYATRSANRIKDLSRKAANQTLTPREQHILGQEQERLANILQSIADVKANAGRILNASKIEVGSDKALSDRVMRMMARADFSDPQAMAKIDKAIEDDRISAKRRENLKVARDIFAQVLNLPRSIMSSMDLSAPFRQGVFFVGRKEFWKAFPEMFKYAFNKKYFEEMENSIRARPTFDLMNKSGLSLTELGHKLSEREEQFMSSWAEKFFPIAASSRAYSGFLNKVRADVFDNIVGKYHAAGIDLTDDPKALKDIGRFINNATGRGDLGKFNEAAPVLAGLLFSPRLMASRVNMLSPWEYVKLDPIVRKEALKSLLSFGAIASTAVGVLATSGASVETDPTSSDFMKAKFGNTRYDLFGGFQQYLVLAARAYYNQKKTLGGEVKDLNSDDYGADDITDVVKDFFRSKLSPNVSSVVNARTGKNIVGEKTTPEGLAANLFVPMLVKDMYEMYGKEGATGVAKMAPGVFGVSVQDFASSGPDLSDPTNAEVARLNKSFDTKLIGSPKRTIDGVKLDDEQYEEYKKLANDWTVETVKQEMATEDWKTMSDEDKAELIKDIAKDMRANAREHLFGQ